MEIYDTLRMINVVVGISVILLVVRAQVRSWRYLSPSERLLLMVVAGYALGASSGSWIAIRNNADANQAQFVITVVQSWAVVALLVSKRRTERLTER